MGIDQKIFLLSVLVGALAGLQGLLFVLLELLQACKGHFLYFRGSCRLARLTFCTFGALAGLLGSLFCTFGALAGLQGSLFCTFGALAGLQGSLLKAEGPKFL